MKQMQSDKRDDRTREFHATCVPERKEKNPIFSHLLQRCSTFTKIRRVLAYVRHFVEATSRRAVPKGSLTVQQLIHSELQLLKWGQLCIDVPRVDEKLIDKPDEKGLIRAHDSLHHLQQKRGHCGYKSLMHDERRKFWIIWLKKMAKAIESECVICRKLCRKTLDQSMGQIPSLRVAAGFPPFSTPLWIKPDMRGSCHLSSRQ